jgi:uncharacterized OsmC-like protein
MPDRVYTVRARTTGIYGRVLASCRQHHWIVDAPDPGEEVTPAELFLGGVATCAAERIERVAKEENIPLTGVRTEIEGTIPEQRIRDDVSIFASVRLDIELLGVNDEDAARLVESFKAG